MDIKDVIARRTDLSTFLIHLTRDADPTPARSRLEQILANWTLAARSPYGAAARRLTDAGQNTDSQRCACFTESPLEHVYWLLPEIDNREIQFRPFGIALPKKEGRRLGINPVWYVDTTPGHDWITNPINALIDEAIHAGAFPGSHIARIVPFVEQMGTWPGNRKEFWWEREWRHVGDLVLPDKIIVLCPEADFVHFQNIVTQNQPPVRSGKFIDPHWGLEQIIGRLAGYTAADIEML